ncbi:TPA: Gfo/Idh/MocA family oxidoreductase [Candidatus Poribacteria bacterium]|nr:Gfo/Idh/MocA family oxidoreductase [Candidatus Poribacteria bacterium]HIN28045.1 Gfo/Idh/MocA family oxidoreductase [Candidatus Poribacteria bacterium]HIO46212.1 Gfo/Idh/MocA family oxidoreductase [Candidatus Poribacteria bacterium]
MSKKTYRAGAIGHSGAGNFGHQIHLAYRGLDNVQFTSIADPDPDGREKAVQEAGAMSSYADYNEMLVEEDLDIVSVCPRWVSEHLDMVLACLNNGCHVYCEKPMTMTLADGDQIVQTAKAKNLKVAVAHQAVYLPRLHQLKQLIESGKIGEVEVVSATGTQDHRGGGEDMIVLGTHLFNMMRFFFGNVDWMSSHVTENGNEIIASSGRKANEPVGTIAGDCIRSYFAFKNGVSGYFQSKKDRAGGEQTYGMDIVGTEGIISLRGGASESLDFYPHRYFNPANQDQKWERLQLENNQLMEGNQLAAIDLIKAIENDKEPISSAADAVAALEMIHGTYVSQLSGSRIYFPISDRSHPLE